MHIIPYPLAESAFCRAFAMDIPKQERGHDGNGNCRMNENFGRTQYGIGIYRTRTYPVSVIGN